MTLEKLKQMDLTVKAPQEPQENSRIVTGSVDPLLRRAVTNAPAEPEEKPEDTAKAIEENINRILGDSANDDREGTKVREPAR